MEFADVTVKESPGLCRCCLSEGCYKDLGSEYSWMNDTEVYADMLLDCFDIGITQHNDGPNGPKRLICEVCITRLRDACNFKKQVVDSEKKFIDMLGRGEFRQTEKQTVLLPVYSGAAPLKAEAIEEVTVPDDFEDSHAEFLEDIDYTEDDELVKSEETVDPTPSSSTSKRGRPRKTESETPEKKPKLKAKAKIAKGNKNTESYLDRLSILRRNIFIVLRYGNVTPFNWNTRGFRCFYCAKQMKDCDVMKEHTQKHNSTDLDSFLKKHIITKDVPVKIDVTDIACNYCPELSITTLDEMVSHVVNHHGEEYDTNVELCFFPFVLHKDFMQCVLCDSDYDNFTSLITHMYKQHVTHSFMCQICGLSFKDQVRLKRHISICHVGHRCTFCDKVFDAFHKLDKHKERFHGQVKTHECSLCSANFKNNYQLRVHLGKEHNVEKYRIKCEHCDKVCTTKGAMVLHVQSMHSEFRYQCDLCEYTTGIKWLVKLHKRKHFAVKDYLCTICEKTFGRSSNLRTHMKVHVGFTGRVCRLCRRGFTDAESLKTHELEFHYYDYY